MSVIKLTKNRFAVDSKLICVGVMKRLLKITVATQVFYHRTIILALTINVFLRKGLTLNSWSLTCLCLLNNGIKGVHNYTQPDFDFQKFYFIFMWVGTLTACISENPFHA